MDIEGLRAAPRRAVGASQTAKAIGRGRAAVVFVARDADRRVTEPVLRAAHARGLEVVEVESMVALGRACGIAVGAAVAAVLSADDRNPAQQPGDFPI
ncbi:MAG TPA: ribosomal L7Ae/L30e/S12e/Gadd45 family protein [bacterium]|nr:ribosomal L7Ae/L30e/S12e/Gadd45 family protein [bacterium]